MKLRTLPRYSNFGVPGTLALLALCFAITHCGSDDPAPAIGSSGKGGSSGSSGMSGSSGRSGSAGSGGASGASGSAGSTAGGSAGAIGADAGSDVADSGSDTSEDGGTLDASDAAEDVIVDPTVRGTLKTPRGLPIEGLTILIGQGTAVSNARGEFTFENVPPTYDLMILPNATKGAVGTHVYVGLTSRRPVAYVAMGESFLRTTVQGTLSTLHGPPGYPQQPLQRTGIGFKAASQQSSATLILRGDQAAGQGPSYGPLNRLDDRDDDHGTTFCSSVDRRRHRVSNGLSGLGRTANESHEWYAGERQSGFGHGVAARSHGHGSLSAGDRISQLSSLRGESDGVQQLSSLRPGSDLRPLCLPDSHPEQRRTGSVVSRHVQRRLWRN